jgi:transcription initiation factor TFIID subunit TAF12
MEHQEELGLLARMSGPMFDEGYIGNQVKAHSKMLAMFELHARTARDSGVRSFAARSVPIVQAHLQMARQLAGLSAEPGGRGGRGRMRNGGSGQNQGGQNQGGGAGNGRGQSGDQ